MSEGKRKKEQIKEAKKDESTKAWTTAVVVAAVLLFMSIGLNIFYAVTLSQQGGRVVAENDSVKSTSSPFMGGSGAGMGDAPEGEEEEEAEPMSGTERELLDAIENKRKELGQNDWKCTNVYIDAKNDANTKFLVYYTHQDSKGEEEDFVTLMEKTGSGWNVKLPGYDISDELLYEAYGLKMVEE